MSATGSPTTRGMRRWLDGLPPRWVLLTVTVLAVAPALVWQAHPKPTGYPDAIAGVVAVALTAVVFMLSAAQNAYQKALDAVVDEFAERDVRICKAAVGDDPEPWPSRMDREVHDVEAVAAMAVLRPRERRRRRRNRDRWADAHSTALRIEWRAVKYVRDAWAASAAERDSRAIDELVEKGLNPGRENLLPAEVRGWDWKREGNDYQAARQRMKALDNEYKDMLDAPLQRADLLPHPSLERRPLSPLAAQFEDVLYEHLRWLDMTYILTVAMFSLTATGIVYGRDALSWPPQPAVLAASIVVVIAIIYISRVHHSMREASLAAARRLNRLTLRTLYEAQILLDDAFVARAVTDGDLVQEALQKTLTYLPADIELPLWHRLLGEYHLARAWKALPNHLAPRPHIADFTSQANGEPTEVMAVRRELDVACRHLERACAHRTDDPVAFLALAGALDAQAAATGKAAEPEPAECAAQVFRTAIGPELADRVWVMDQLRTNQWLLPREPGGLTELLKPVPSYSPAVGCMEPTIQEGTRESSSRAG